MNSHYIIFCILFLLILILFYYIIINKNIETFVITEECDNCYNNLSNDLLNKLVNNLKDQVNQNSSNINMLLKNNDININKISVLQEQMNENNGAYMEDDEDNEEDIF